MKQRLRHWTVAAISWVAPLAAFSAEPANQHGALGRYIPSDVWMYVAGSHIEEREFLDAHWRRVWDAGKKSGVGTELRTMLETHMSAEEKAKFKELWDTGCNLCAKVKWSDLFCGEVAMAWRSESLTPEIFVLMQPRPETLEANVNGLAGIFASVSEMSTDFRFTWTQLDGAKLWALEANDAPIGLYMLHKDDVVGLFVGKQAMEDTRGLLAGDGKKQSITTDARFIAASKQVPPSKFSTVYTDFDRLLRFLGRLPDMMAGEHSDAQEIATVRKVMKHVIESCDIVDYSIHSGRIEGLREFFDGYTQLKGGCESKPLYKIFGSQKRLDNVCQYVPAEAVCYSASSGMNFNEAYNAVADLIKDQIPDGATHWASWEKAQQDAGFNLQDDVLSWIGGEMVSVTMPAAIQSPFGGADEVSMLRVTNAAKARQKLDYLIDKLNSMLAAHDQGLIIQPAQKVPAEGFRTVTHPMMAMLLRPCVGVWDEWLVIGTSESAITAVMDTKAGKRPDFRENPRFKLEGLVPEGQVCSASFTDLSNMGQEFAAAAGMMSFIFGMTVPDQPETRGMKTVMGIIGKLTPAIMEINFFSSTSTVSTFDGKCWRTTNVTNYKDVPTKTTTASGP